MDSENKKLRISVAQTDDSFIIMSKAIMAMKKYLDLDDYCVKSEKLREMVDESQSAAETLEIVKIYVDVC
jgi:hypothetical protein